MTYLSSEEERDHRVAQREKRAKLRKNNKSKTLAISRKLVYKLLQLMKNSGHNRLKLSQYSGISPASVSRLTLKRTIDTVPFSSVVGLARASGYKLEFVRLTPEEDDFFDDRWLKASDFYDEKVNKGDEKPQNRRT